MEFKAFNQLLVNHFNRMVRNASALFRVDCSNDYLWDLYLDSFPAGTNEIYRKRREFDCSCCHHFFRQMANVVTVKDGVITSIWDFEIDNPTFGPVVKALREEVHNHPIGSIFFYNSWHGSRVGSERTVSDGCDGIEIWNHFFVDLPQYALLRGDAIGTRMGDVEASKSVLKRSLEEFDLESINTVLELINQKSLYRGDEWKKLLNDFKNLKVNIDIMINENERTNLCWEKAVEHGAAFARIRNHSIGTLLIDISAGMDLDQAVRRYEAVVAPANYKRPKAIFTQKMLEDAKKKIESMGYMDSLARRHATADDITVNNILFCNRDAAKRVSGASSLFDELEKSVAVDPRKFNRATEISIDDFISGVLPTAKEVEVLMENRHESNLVSLIAPENRDAKSMFKWENNFSWAYKGNITDSDIKQNVKNAGGKVDAPLRFSIQWNDTEADFNDLDAHALLPGEHISFMATKGYVTLGELDVDIIRPQTGKPAVENIVYPDIDKLKNKTVKFHVNCYSNRGGRSGFRAEIEVLGQVFSYDYRGSIAGGQNVKVAEVSFDQYGDMSIHHALKAAESISTHEVWNISTSQFVPVSMIMFSPNYWDEQTGNGHRHVFFMLKDCINDESPNGMYNEFLKNELLEHKRVFEALGAKMAVKPTNDQLSGVGFSTTKRNNLIVKVKGATERILNVKF